MTDVDARARAPFGSSVLVALGWYATVLTAVLVALDGIPSAPRTDCATFAGCMSPMQATGMALVVVGVPAVIVVVLATPAVAALTTRLTGSSIVAGTLAAAGCAVLVGGIGEIWLVAASR